MSIDDYCPSCQHPWAEHGPDGCRSELDDVVCACTRRRPGVPTKAGGDPGCALALLTIAALAVTAAYTFPFGP